MSGLPSNKYGGVCAASHCHLYVEPGAGVRVRLGDSWKVYCPADVPGQSPLANTAGVTLKQPLHSLAPRGETNRFAGLCMECSVPVAAGAATLTPCNDGKRRARCPVCEEVAIRCERWDENDQYGQDPWITDIIPAGCSATIQLRVLSLDRACWKCHQTTTCVVGLYPHRPAPTDPRPRTVNETSRIWLKELLAGSGYIRLAESIKPRWSGTHGARYLSSGCLHCDALQGDFPLEEEASDLVREKGVDALQTLLVAEVATPVWQRTVHGERGRGDSLLE
ncbi:hypothetical protein ACFWCB_14085 [Streptomyces sp. NPDC060048]|uniref:hypothetical protein n=1 Tax=unclassified Streptomyces TaxID=2593676 RepID=UPI0036B9590E